MSAQLEQLLGYLERDGVTEVVIGAGKPIAMRTERGLTNITARPLSSEQLASMVRGTAVAPLIPDRDGELEPAEVQVGRRRAMVRIARRGDVVYLSLTRAEGKPPLATQPIAKVAAPPDAAQTTSSRTATMTVPARFVAPAAPTRAPATGPSAFDSFSLDDAVELAGGDVPAATESSIRFSSSSARPAARPANPSGSLDIAVDLDPGPSNAPSLGAFDAAGIDIDMGTNPPTSSRASTTKLPSGPALTGRPASTTGHPGLDLGFSLELDDDLDARPAGEPVRLNRSPLSGAPAVSPSPLAGLPQAPPPAPAVATPRAPALASPTSTRIEAGDFARIVDAARQRRASDLHISAARVTSIRVNGELVPLDATAPPLSARGAEDLLLPLLDPSLRAQLDSAGYIDLALDLPSGGRLRANISRQQQGLKGTFRLALAKPATLDELGLPADLAKVVGHHQGLVIIAGPSGHGKTTTLAALVDLLSSTRAFHILTIEDPVEIIHPRKQAVISQRETGRHTASFARGLKASLREDPDVIVIGELRDRESVEIALTAAETGHLVIATMSTPSAAKTLDRLIDMFPPEDHSQVRASVAGALRAIVAQRLLPKRGGGVVPAIELVTGVLPLAVLIREDKLYQLPNLMQRGRAFGMIRFDESLAELVRSGRLDEDIALGAAESKKDLAAVLRPQAPAQPSPKTSQLWGFGKKENR